MESKDTNLIHLMVILRVISINFHFLFEVEIPRMQESVVEMTSLSQAVLCNVFNSKVLPPPLLLDNHFFSQNQVEFPGSQKSIVHPRANT